MIARSSVSIQYINSRVKVAGPDLLIWMDKRQGFPGNHLMAANKPVVGRVILKYVLTDPDLVAAYYSIFFYLV